MIRARVTDSRVGPGDKPAPRHLANRDEDLGESMDTVSLATALEPNVCIVPNKDTDDNVEVDVDIEPRGDGKVADHDHLHNDADLGRPQLDTQQRAFPMTGKLFFRVS